MMSPLEYLFVMMMKTNQPDANALARVEPASGGERSVENQNPITVNKSGMLEMRTILMQAQDSNEEKLEAPLRITKEWAPLFKIGAPMNITVDESGKSYTARVARIVTIRDQSGETMQVIAEMGREEVALKPGQTATATMTQPATFN